jgi:hypothetical protein
MPNLALVALLSGSLLTGSPDGDRDKDKSRAQAPTMVAQDTPAAPTDVRAITNDTYAFGRPADEAPIKAWVAYAYGVSESVWAADDETVEYDLDGPGPGNVSGDVTSQRIIAGVQLNVINFPAFKLGVGGQLVAGSNVFEFDSDSDGPDVFGADQLESGFGLQSVKPFIALRGSVVGVHAGYLLDLAETDADAAPPEFALSDERDAIQLGADFDYPSENFRLFAGADYFMLQDNDEIAGGTDGNNIVFWNAGAGLRFGFIEIGAALLMRTVFERGTAAGLAVGPRDAEGGGTSVGTNTSGGHAGTIAPYLKLAPPSIPVSLFVKGAVLEEYTDYGYALGGGNEIKPAFGFTAGLTLGFN